MCEGVKNGTVDITNEYTNDKEYMYLKYVYELTTFKYKGSKICYFCDVLYKYKNVLSKKY